MLTQLIIAVSALTFVSAGPISGSPPAGFDPSKVYPPNLAFQRRTYYGQGVHYNITHAQATKVAAKLSAAGQPQWGPGSFVTDPGALSWYNPNLSAGTTGVQPSNSYKCFSGNLGDYPPPSSWMNFYDMFTLNQRNAMTGTGVGSAQGPDTGDQQTQVYNAILTVSNESKVDARLILAVIMQESGGWVWAPCTAGYNCGLMQANHGSVSYNSADSQNSINQMVLDGTEGTTQGPGYVQYLNSGPDYAYTHCASGNPYASARAYNTGSCSVGGNMNCAQYGTASYVNDIANRLIGWDATGAPQGSCGFPAVGCV